MLRFAQSFGMGMLCANRTAEDFSKHDLRMLMDGVRLGTITTFEAFKHAWEAIMISVQNAVLQAGIQHEVQQELIRFMVAMKDKWSRLRALGSILPGKLTWAAKRTFIQNVCGWSEDGALDHVQFRQDHKDLQMLSQLYKFSEEDSLSENPYGKTGVFGSEKVQKPKQKCTACGNIGHIAANCHSKRGNKAKDAKDDRKCYKCDQKGHIKAHCPN
jgi:hypothetical protein